MSENAGASRLLPYAVALIVGAALSWGTSRLLEQLEDPEAMARPEAALSRPALVKRLVGAEATVEELRAKLSAKTEEAAQVTGQLGEAGKKVEDLQARVSAKEGEVKLLELKVRKAQGRSAALEKELETKKSELDALQTQLDQALAEKARLQKDLDVSRAETATAKAETVEANRATDAARDEAVEAKWQAFSAQAQVDICEVRWKSRLRKCKEEVAASLGRARGQRFKQCVSSGQAAPRLLRVDPKEKDPSLPKWSEWFNQDSSFTEDKWYIVFCDPTLPEAGGAGRNAAPRGGRDLPETEELEDL
jgi:predicted  nucleic acid-binding Zn-ribbon protein